MSVHYIGFGPPSQLNERVWLGCWKDSQDHEFLSRHDITAVANLTQDDYLQIVEHQFWAMQEDCLEVPELTITRFLEWMDEQEREGRTVLVHCHAGISRTSAFIIAWLMHRRGVTQEQDLRSEWSAAEDQVGRVRPIIQPHYELKRSVLRYFEGRAA